MSLDIILKNACKFFIGIDVYGKAKLCHKGEAKLCHKGEGRKKKVRMGKGEGIPAERGM